MHIILPLFRFFIKNRKMIPLKITAYLLLVVLNLIIFTSCHEKKMIFQSQRNLDFNEGWRFINDSITGAEHPDFDDSGWRIVDLPHDWSIEDYPVQDSIHTGPFDKNLRGGKDVGYLRGGTGWYRKKFTISHENAGKRVMLHFDGVQSEMSLWVNGREAGSHIYGYTPFYFDITPYLKKDGNTIAIRVKKPEENSRWFTGAGIYRSVGISFVDPVHVETWGVKIDAHVLNSASEIDVESVVFNNGQDKFRVLVKTSLLAPSGNTIELPEKQSDIGHGKKAVFSWKVMVTDPELWDIDNPRLYKAVVQVWRDGRQIDEYIQKFGVRKIAYSADRGFLLNGKPVLLKGGCLHHDNGLLGAAAFKRAEERRVRIMKENGFNTIRTSHNPPSQYFLDACDELGMLVIDESFDMWSKPKRPNDYHQYFKEWWRRDLEAMLLRDRNHPSIIMWSIGNEIPERADSTGLAIAKEMINHIKSIDHSRPVTQAVCGFWDNPGKEWREAQPVFAQLDVSGYNYQWKKYESDHEQFPERVMYGSESVSKEAFENWQKVKELPYVIGDFVWTGMDYIGEAGIGHTVYKEKDTASRGLMAWPWYVGWCGDIDLIGNKKPPSFYRDILWENSKLEMMVHEPVPSEKHEVVSMWGWPNEFASWNWAGHENEVLFVNIYTTWPEVQLELNGEIIGKKAVSASTKYTATFDVSYKPGILKAVAIEYDEIKEEKILKTTGKVSELVLAPEREIIPASKGEVAFINISGVDEEGDVVPDAATRLTVRVEGAGTLMAAGNASPFVQGSFRDEKFHLFHGKGLIIVRSNGRAGDITVTVDNGHGISSEVIIRVE